MCSGTHFFLALAVLCCIDASASDSAEIDALSSQSKRCTYEDAYSYHGAFCSQLGLAKIPSLKDSIEFLEFNENKLLELKTNTFSSLTGLRMLYLAENKIYKIEEDAFAALINLRSLDLSRNVIQQIPKSLFQLPALRKLYLNGNPLTHMSSTYSLSKPIKAPIEYLDISECGLSELWNWGILPQLHFYNISLNPLVHLEVSHFVEMCNLRRVDLSKSIDSVRLCDLKPSIKWLQQRHVEYLLLEDSQVKLKSKEFANCAENTISDELNATNRLCLVSYKEPVPDSHNSGNTWVRLCGGLAGFLVGFMLLLYVFHRYNVAKTKRQSEKKLSPVQTDKHSSELLLKETSSA